MNPKFEEGQVNVQFNQDQTPNAQVTDHSLDQQHLKKSNRVRKLVISEDYVYHQMTEFDYGDTNDPVTY